MNKKSPNGYWTREIVTSELKRVADELGHFPTRDELKSRNLGGLIGAVQKDYGGLIKLSTEMGYSNNKHPSGYWKKIENVDAALKPIIAELGHFPSQSELSDGGYQNLLGGIYSHHGGIDQVRSRSGAIRLEKSRGYWKDWHNVENAVTELKIKLGHPPSVKEIRENAPALYNGLKRHHGGAIAVSTKLGINVSKLANGHWHSWDKVKSRLEQLTEQLGHFPTQPELRQLRQSSLVAAIVNNHGGMNQVRENMGYGEGSRKDNGYWLVQDNFDRELKVVINELGHFPTQRELQKIKPVIATAANHFGGLNNVGRRMGYNPSMKDGRYWQNWDNVEIAVQAVVEKLGYFPTQRELKEHGESGVSNGISRWHKGLGAVRQKMLSEVRREDDSQRILEGYLEAII